jgi:hypothetical protein
MGFHPLISMQMSDLSEERPQGLAVRRVIFLWFVVIALADSQFHLVTIYKDWMCF